MPRPSNRNRNKKEFEALAPHDRLGDAPVEAQYHQLMTAVMHAVDMAFNGDPLPATPDKQVGIIMLVFPYGDKEGRCNYISNGADRTDVVTLMKEMVARFESRYVEKGGTA